MISDIILIYIILAMARRGRKGLATRSVPLARGRIPLYKREHYAICIY